MVWMTGRSESMAMLSMEFRAIATKTDAAGWRRQPAEVGATAAKGRDTLP
jgi:hypothetical protein